MITKATMIDQLAKKHCLRLLLMHGSQVGGRVHERSDIDVAFLARSKIDLLKLVGDLIRVFGDKVDVTDLNTANPLLLKNIMADYKVLYADRGAEDNLKILSFKKYIDYLPYLSQESEFVNSYYKVNEG